MRLNEENLMAFFTNNGKYYSVTELRRIFKVRGEEETNLLNELLSKLEDDAFIFEGKNGFSALAKRDDLIQGKIAISKTGRGYVKVNGADISIPIENLHGALTGDTVLVKKISVDKTSKITGAVSKVVKRDRGIISLNYSNGVLTPYKTPMQYEIRLSRNEMKQLENDTRIAVRVDNIPENGVLDASLVYVIGHKDDVDLDERTIAIENGFDLEFPEAVKEEVRHIPTYVTEEEKEGRLDLRDKTIFTIDGVHTKDIDDAVSIEINEKGNYVLGVHIADVSHYVTPESAIFEEARNRGTSLYLNDTSVPMLPRELSNGICSLNPEVDRLAKSVFMEIDKDGNIIDYKIRSSLINSKKKMNYDDVNRVVEEGIIPEGYEPYVDNLMVMNNLSKLLTKVKNNRGYLSFGETDVETKFDELGNPIDFKVNKQKSAESLIENFMLAANETVANHFINMGYPGIYRVHDIPDKDKMTKIMNFISCIGFKIKNIKNVSNPKAVQGLLKELKNQDAFPILSNLLLRGMQKAEFSPENIGHFGLALDNYIQFTSPIRRFPDLIAHTVLTQAEDLKVSYEDLCELESKLEEYAKHASFKERQAQTAEYDATNMRMAEYMEGNIGKHFNGTIVDIGSFGTLVKTDNQVTGRCTFKDIKGDYYKLDPSTFSLHGAKTKQVYRIGNHVRVRVKDASKENRTVDYEILGKVKDQTLRLK